MDLLRVYILNQSFHWLIVGLYFPIMVLFLLDKGLDILQVGTVVGASSREYWSLMAKPSKRNARLPKFLSTSQSNLPARHREHTAPENSAGYNITQRRLKELHRLCSKEPSATTKSIVATSLHVRALPGEHGQLELPAGRICSRWRHAGCPVSIPGSGLLVIGKALPPCRWCVRWSSRTLEGASQKGYGAGLRATSSVRCGLRCWGAWRGTSGARAPCFPLS